MIAYRTIQKRPDRGNELEKILSYNNKLSTVTEIRAVDPYSLYTDPVYLKKVWTLDPNQI